MKRRFAPRGASITERLDAQSIPEPNSGCHLWVGALQPNGYGVLTVNNLARYAHRVAYETQVEFIPSGMHIDHLCRNRACINVAHLEVVTPKENARRGAEARRNMPAVPRRKRSLFPRKFLTQVSEKQRAWLDQQADARGLSVAAIVREIVQQAMTAEQQTAQQREGAA